MVEGSLGFDIEAQAAVFRPREQESESDVSVSSVPTEELSDLSESEEEEDDDSQWNDNNNPVEVSPFTAATGLTWGVTEDGTAIDFFYLMFPEDLIEHIVSETNRFAQECIAAKPDPKWRESTLEEMKAFLGVHVLFGIKQLPANHFYWSSDPLIIVPSVQKVMSRNHFHKLSHYFHLNNNARRVP
ncbi:piggyBac transposable element-derived protein 4-like [Stylophora pistillata]|uniref:piggyBac transposable element-derived protein 4-like n=1 Tax=Stylophora pistillata TaxID=50429 RepID=UPI000C044BFB|nr:piggyBac transposable element-derived protein 4-like [Stylophora pistillata]